LQDKFLSNLTAMSSQTFANKKFNGKIVGNVDMDKMNTKGGSLSLGHPFGATGCRLVTTAVRWLQQEGDRFALLAASKKVPMVVWDTHVLWNVTITENIQ
jgi:acetyl-CoA acetyltransferase